MKAMNYLNIVCVLSNILHMQRWELKLHFVQVGYNQKFRTESETIFYHVSKYIPVFAKAKFQA
jgi:hypothetical protein